jgi:hypothetical protein
LSLTSAWAKNQGADGWMSQAVGMRCVDASSGRTGLHQSLPLLLTAGASSHLLQVFHRKLCARKTSLCGLQ